MSPPRWVIPTTTKPATAGRSAKGRALRRDVLLQCERCSAKGTGRVAHGRTLAALGIAGFDDHGVWRHSGCGGRIEGFDIVEEAR